MTKRLPVAQGGKSPKMTPEEKITCLTMKEAGKSVGEIAYVVKRNVSTVSRYLAGMMDSSLLARMTLKAGASTLAERIIRKADVKESIEVLSRPDMGVLKPAERAGGGGGMGIRVSVGVASCGTVVQVEASNGNEASRLEAGSDVARSDVTRIDESRAPVLEVARILDHQG